MNGVVRIISIGLIANLIPLFGVLYWQWDAFQLLMLYWTETVIIAFWTIVGISECGKPSLARDQGRDHRAMTG